MTQIFLPESFRPTISSFFSVKSNEDTSLIKRFLSKRKSKLFHRGKILGLPHLISVHFLYRILIKLGVILASDWTTGSVLFSGQAPIGWELGEVGHTSGVPVSSQQELLLLMGARSLGAHGKFLHLPLAGLRTTGLSGL